MDNARHPSISLGLLLHNHQPVGNFPWVFQQVYEESYLPMLTALEQHPRVRLSLHYTGSLLDWLQEHHPQFLTRLRLLVQRKQVEIVSGGYYEPILPSIPDADKLGQIRHLNKHLTTLFDSKPDGAWLAERVWEPSLPAILHDAEIDWTILDDVHFQAAGLATDDLYGYYLTEDQGKALKIFATSKFLRYTIPWRPVEEIIAHFRSLATLAGDRILLMGDDGEKFGSWPGTGQHCWGQDGRSGWIETFFSALEAENDWLHTIPLGEYTHQNPALGRIYLPTSSYIEMTQWALPPEQASTFEKLTHQFEEEKRNDILQFMRGGLWRNFLVRYPEVNNQHKKMLRIHKQIYQAGATPEVGLLDLWKAQANDTYWHGLFGGIYMTHVRAAIYHHLLRAENALARQEYGLNHWQRSEYVDFDFDTQEELIIESDQQNLYLAPLRGGALFEWDLRRSMHNILSVMTRQLESYHQKLIDYEQTHRQQPQRANTDTTNPGSPHTTVRVKEPDLDQYLVIDSYQRYSMLDHFLPAELTLTDFAKSTFHESGDFIGKPYSTTVNQSDRGITIVLAREGTVHNQRTDQKSSIFLQKELFLPIGQEKLEITYTLTNRSSHTIATTFACEWNCNLLGGGHNPQAYYQIGEKRVTFDSTGETQEITDLRIGNSWLEQEIRFQLSQAAKLWRFSLDTVTDSEAGFERTHQGSCMSFLWPLLLHEGEQWKVQIHCTGKRPD